MLTHDAVASRFLGEDVIYEALADWTKAPVRPEVKATLGMLAKLTCQPFQFGTSDMLLLLKMGITLAGIQQVSRPSLDFQHSLSGLQPQPGKSLLCSDQSLHPSAFQESGKQG